MTSAEPLCGGTAWASHLDIPDAPSAMHDPDTWCVYLAMATDILWAATGRRWRGSGRTATATLRSDRRGSGNYHDSWGRCTCSHTSSLYTAHHPWMAHHEPSRVRLPHDDITAITSVTLDGAAFTEWDWHGGWLTRTDGRGWPMCGDRTVINYAYGRNPPSGGHAACVELAIELGREGAGAATDQECRLPRRASTVNRQGLTYTTETYLDYLADGLTGLIGPDMWIKSMNPGKRAQAASVWSPDLRYARRIP